MERILSDDELYFLLTNVFEFSVTEVKLLQL